MAGKKQIEYTISADLIIKTQGIAGKSASQAAAFNKGFKGLEAPAAKFQEIIKNFSSGFQQFNAAMEKASQRYVPTNKAKVEAAFKVSNTALGDLSKLRLSLATELNNVINAGLKRKKIDFTKAMPGRIESFSKNFKGSPEQVAALDSFKRLNVVILESMKELTTALAEQKAQMTALDIAKSARRRGKKGEVVSDNIIPEYQSVPGVAVSATTTATGHVILEAAKIQEQAAETQEQAAKMQLNAVNGDTTAPAGKRERRTEVEKLNEVVIKQAQNLQSFAGTFGLKIPGGTQTRQEYYNTKMNELLAKPGATVADLEKLKTTDQLFAEISNEIDSFYQASDKLSSSINKLRIAAGGTLSPEAQKAIDTSKLHGPESIGINSEQAAKTLTEEEKKRAEAAERAAKSAENEKEQRENILRTQQKEVQQNVKKISQNLKIASVLKQIVKYTLAAFSIYSIQYGIRQVYTYLQNLDKAITNIGVVTGYSREQLRGMTKDMNVMATQLGKTTKDIAEAALLFYQQGKSAAEVTKLVEATVKSASIAMIDEKTASSELTAALNGFSLAATDAMRVADVFAKLGAMSAADFSELAGALTKTASQSKTAGMSIETTTAFLAKMIEVTRESPENLGTAWKTITARFAQFTKDPNMLIDDEPINKVGAALKAVGISALDANGELRNFDDVIIELGGKWNSLDRNMKQYLATALAGSRQQSRFLALMNDFDRTMQLVTAAQNSAGSANEQYNRHMQGMEAAVNKMTASIEAWYLSITNSDAIIGFINHITDLIGLLNKVPLAIQGVVIAMVAGFAKMGNSISKFALELGTVENQIKFVQKLGKPGVGEAPQTFGTKMQRMFFGSKITNIADEVTLSNRVISQVAKAQNQAELDAVYANLKLDTNKLDGITKTQYETLSKTVGNQEAYNKAIVTINEENEVKLRQAGQQVQNATVKVAGALQAASVAIAGFTAAAAEGATGDVLGGGITGGLSGGMSGMMVVTALGGATAIGATAAWIIPVVGAIIGIAIPIISYFANKSELDLKKLKQEIEDEITTRDKTNTQIESVQNLYNEYIKLNNILIKNKEELARFYEVQDELIAQVPGLTTSYDNTGTRIINDTTLIENQLNTLAESARQSQMQIYKKQLSDIGFTEINKNVKSAQLTELDKQIRDKLFAFGVQSTSVAVPGYTSFTPTEQQLQLQKEIAALEAQREEEFAKVILPAIKERISQVTAYYKLTMIEAFKDSNMNDAEKQQMADNLGNIITNVLNMVEGNITFTSKTPEQQKAIEDQIITTLTSASFRSSLTDAEKKALSDSRYMTDELKNSIIAKAQGSITEQTKANLEELGIAIQDFNNVIAGSIISTKDILNKMGVKSTSTGGVSLGSMGNNPQYHNTVLGLGQLYSGTAEGSKPILNDILNKLDWSKLLPSSSDYTDPEALAAKLKIFQEEVQKLGLSGTESQGVIDSLYEKIYNFTPTDATSALTEFESKFNTLAEGMQEDKSWVGSFAELKNVLDATNLSWDQLGVTFDAVTGKATMNAASVEKVAAALQAMSSAALESSIIAQKNAYLTTGSEEARQEWMNLMLVNEQIKQRNILETKQYQIKALQDKLDKFNTGRDSFIDISQQLYSVITEQINKAYDERIKLSEDAIELLNKENEAYDKQLEKIRTVRDLQEQQKNLNDLQTQYAQLALQGPSEALFDLEQRIMEAGQEYRNFVEDQNAEAHRQAIEDSIQTEEDKIKALEDERKAFLEDYEYMWEQVDAIIQKGPDAIKEVLSKSDAYLKSSQQERDKMIEDWDMAFVNIKNSGRDFLNDTNLATKKIKDSAVEVANQWKITGLIVTSKDSWVVQSKVQIDELNKSLEKTQMQMNTLLKEVHDTDVAMGASEASGSAGLLKSTSVPSYVKESILNGVFSKYQSQDFNALSVKDKSYIKTIYDALANEPTLRAKLLAYFKLDPKVGIPAFATGGLVGYTGTAMLHGTPTKPEAVLNPDQTEAFMSLVNSLVRIESKYNSLGSIARGSTSPIINVGGVTIEAKTIDANADLDAIAQKLSDKIARKVIGTTTTTLNPRLSKN